MDENRDDTEQKEDVWGNPRVTEDIDDGPVQEVPDYDPETPRNRPWYQKFNKR